mmetsp:Transcript_113838/g.361837  ORF Transcript_113838/g.361837 Transcript_113838/m.361837 type:complete len:381 (-) Transcript_113838:788-1930(-)
MCHHLRPRLCLHRRLHNRLCHHLRLRLCLYLRLHLHNRLSNRLCLHNQRHSHLLLTIGGHLRLRMLLRRRRLPLQLRLRRSRLLLNRRGRKVLRCDRLRCNGNADRRHRWQHGCRQSWNSTDKLCDGRGCICTGHHRASWSRGRDRRWCNNGWHSHHGCRGGWDCLGRQRRLDHRLWDGHRCRMCLLRHRCLRRGLIGGGGARLRNQCLRHRCDRSLRCGNVLRLRLHNRSSKRVHSDHLRLRSRRQSCGDGGGRSGRQSCKLLPGGHHMRGHHPRDGRRSGRRGRRRRSGPSGRDCRGGDGRRGGRRGAQGMGPEGNGQRPGEAGGLCRSRIRRHDDLRRGRGRRRQNRLRDNGVAPRDIHQAAAGAEVLDGLGLEHDA